MKTKFLLIFLGLLILLATKAQEITFPEISGFRITKNYPVFTRENLYDFINGAAEIYLTYGFLNLNVVEYRKGRDVIKAEVYRHSDHTMAFGIYSSERSNTFRFLNLGAQGYISGGIINFFKGRYYVKIRTFSQKEKTIQSAQTLALKLSQMLEGETVMPPMVEQFPREGRKLNEETYIFQDVLGHSFLNRAFRANYEAGPDSFSIYIIQEGSAESLQKTINSYLASAGIDPVYENEGKIVLNDGYNGPVFLVWSDRMIIIITGLARDQAEIADKYSSEILK